MKDYDENNDSINEWKEWFINNHEYDKPTTCPCCGGNVTIYQRELEWSLVAFLIAIVKLRAINGNKLQHHNEVCNYAKDHLDIYPTNYSLTKKWNLVLSPKNGYYELSPRGYKFLAGDIKLPKHLIIWNGKIINESKDLVCVWDINPDNINKYIRKNRNKSEEENE